ncbi:MAG: FAD-dependent monooxygenase [Pseudomonadota bacterium]
MTGDSCDILVIGSGPAGLATAIVAARLGFDTVLVDEGCPNPVVDPRGQSVALMPSARDRLIDMELWDTLEPASVPIARVRVQDVATGMDHLYRAKDLDRAALAYAIDGRALWQGLDRAASDEPKLRRRPGPLVDVDLHAGWRRGILRDGSVVDARLVVGADGRDSTVREAAALTARRSDLPELALVFQIRGTALENETIIEQLRANGPLSILPLGGDRFAVNWVDGPNQTERRLRGGATTLGELAEALSRPGVADMTLLGGLSTYRLGVLHADRYVAPRLVLVGEAAHGAQPVHAQGFNLAVGDVHELATLWRVEGPRFATQDVLARYQHVRRLASATRLGTTDVMNRLFTVGNAPWAFDRGSVSRTVLDEQQPLVAETSSDDRTATRPN